MARAKSGRDRIEVSAAVQYIARMALYMGAAFFLLALAALVFMSPGAVSRGLYYVILGLNALVIVGAVLLTRYMRRSDEKYAREKKAAQQEPGIDDWLAKRAGTPGAELHARPLNAKGEKTE